MAFNAQIHSVAGTSSIWQAADTSWSTPITILNINDKSYDIDKRSAEAIAQVQSLQFVDAELARLNATVAVFQTVRIGYLNALAPQLNAIGEISKTLQ